MIEKIKDIVWHMSFYWNFKELLISYPLIMLMSTLIFSQFGVTWWWIAPIILAIIPIATMVIHWFKVIKPVIKQVEEEAMLEKKYAWMYERFTKREG